MFSHGRFSAIQRHMRHPDGSSGHSHWNGGRIGAGARDWSPGGSTQPDGSPSASSTSTSSIATAKYIYIYNSVFCVLQVHTGILFNLCAQCCIHCSLIFRMHWGRCSGSSKQQMSTGKTEDCTSGQPTDGRSMRTSGTYLQKCRTRFRQWMRLVVACTALY